MIGLTLIPKKWVPRIVQLYLIFGFAEWIRIAFVYVEQRQLVGDDYQRLAIILGGVALFTLLSGLMCELKGLKGKYF